MEIDSLIVFIELLVYTETTLSRECGVHEPRQVLDVQFSPSSHSQEHRMNPHSEILPVLQLVTPL